MRWLYYMFWRMLITESASIFYLFVYRLQIFHVSDFLLCFWSMLHVTLENLSESWEVLVSQLILVHGGA
jgi:hypothetical protein